MAKRIIVLISAVLIVFGITACKKIDNGQGAHSTKASSTVKETRIHNNFKDVLPKFDFDSELLENYKEGMSYSFSAECSKNKFKKYVEKVRKAGFDSKVTEGEGYFAAYSDDGYYTEMTLIGERITVYIKRK